MDSGGALSIREGGSDPGYSYFYSEGSVLAITYDGSTITYLLDGLVARTVSVSGLTLYADASMYSPGGQLKDIHFGPTTVLEVPTIDEEMRKVIPDSNFSLSDVQVYWAWPGSTGVSLSKTGGVGGGRLILTGNSTNKTIISRNVLGVRVITGQLFKLILRWRRTGTLTCTTLGNSAFQASARTTAFPASLGSGVGSGSTTLSGTTVNATTVNEWQVMEVAVTVANFASNLSQAAYLTVQIDMFANVTGGVIEVEQVELVAN